VETYIIFFEQNLLSCFHSSLHASFGYAVVVIHRQKDDAALKTHAAKAHATVEDLAGRLKRFGLKTVIVE
jgi:hypothetical protein